MVNLFDVNGDAITIPDLWRARFSFNKSEEGALRVREYSESDDLTTLRSEINFRFSDKIAFGLVRPGHVCIVGKLPKRGTMYWVMREFYIGPKERHAVETLTDIVEAFYSWLEAQPKRHHKRARLVLGPNECWLQDTEIRSPRDGGPVVAHKGHHVRYELPEETFLWSTVNTLLREKITRPTTPLRESFVLCEQHHYWCPAVENLFLKYGGQFPPELILLPVERRTLMGGEAFFADIDWTPLPPSSENSEAELETVDDDEDWTPLSPSSRYFEAKLERVDDDGEDWTALSPSSRVSEADLEMVDDDEEDRTALSPSSRDSETDLEMVDDDDEDRTALSPSSRDSEADLEMVDDDEEDRTALSPSSRDSEAEPATVDDDEMNGEADAHMLQIVAAENATLDGIVFQDDDSFVPHGYTKKTRKMDDGNHGERGNGGEGGDSDNDDEAGSGSDSGTGGEGNNGGEGGYGSGSDSGTGGEGGYGSDDDNSSDEPMDTQEAPMFPEEPPLSLDIMASPMDAGPDLTSGSGLEALPEIGLYGLPANIKNWTAEDVAEWLRAIGYGEYATEFVEEEIDGAALMLLKAEHLMQGMNVKLGPALKVCKKIEELQASCNVSVPPAPKSGPASE